MVGQAAPPEFLNAPFALERKKIFCEWGNFGVHDGGCFIGEWQFYFNFFWKNQYIYLIFVCKSVKMATKNTKSELMEDKYGPVSRILKGVFEPQKPFTTLGKEIKISPKSKVDIFLPGASIEFHKSSVQVIIGIGNNHTAHLVMDIETLEALKAGSEIDITTLKNFKEKLK